MTIMIKAKQICVLVAACFALCPGARSEVLPIPDERVVPAGPYLTIAHDAGGARGIKEMLQSDALFARNTETEPSFGYTRGAVWARFELENPGNEHIVAVLELPVARLRRIDWFVTRDGAVLDELADGLEGTVGSFAGSRFPMAAACVPPGERRTVFVRVESDTAIWLPLRVFNVLDYARHVSCGDLLDDVFIGFGAAMFLLAFFHWLLLKKRHYLLLSLLVLFFMGYHLIFNGYYRLLGGPFPIWVNRQFMLALGLGAHWAFLRFSMLYVKSESGRREVVPAFVWISRLLGAGSVVLCVIPFMQGVWLLVALLPLCYISGTVLALRHASRSRTWYDWLFFAVWLLASLTVVLMMAQFLGWMRVLVEPANLQRMIVPLVFAAFFAVLSAQRNEAEKHRSSMEQARRAAAEAELHALRYQLNPHFLFNTLNSIDALSSEAPARIPGLISRLAEFLRSRINPSPSGLLAIEEELDSVRAYLDIEKVRFEEHLQVSYETEAAVLSREAPEMIIQPLVENAIKHGMAVKGALSLKIIVRREGGQMLIRVEHDGELAGQDRAEGVGLKNLRSRLLYHYAGRASFVIRGENGRVIAEIRLPFGEDDA